MQQNCIRNGSIYHTSERNIISPGDFRNNLPEIDVV